MKYVSASNAAIVSISFYVYLRLPTFYGHIFLFELSGSNSEMAEKVLATIVERDIRVHKCQSLPPSGQSCRKHKLFLLFLSHAIISSTVHILQSKK